MEKGIIKSQIDMGPWSFWLILGVGTLIIEVLSTSAVCIYLSLGSFVAMVCSLLGWGWEITIPAFVLSTLLFYLATYRWRKRLLASMHKSSGQLPTGMDALIGRQGRVVESAGTLRIKIDGDSWQVRSADDNRILHVGDFVKIVGYDSIILSAEPVTEEV